jgi:hypothetical protein
MSLIKAMRMVEDFTDEMLEQAVRGMGNMAIPSYVALSEMQRRANLRKSAEASQPTPEGTVADRKIQEARSFMPQNVMNNSGEMSAPMPRQGFQAAGQVFSLADYLKSQQEDEKESKLEQFVDQYFANRKSGPSLRRTPEQMDRRLDVEALSSLASAISKPTLGKAAESLASDARKIGGLRDQLETQDRLAAQAEVDRLDKEFATQLGAMEKVASADRAGDVLNLQTGIGLSNEAIEKAKQFNEAEKNKILAAAQEVARSDKDKKLVVDFLSAQLVGLQKQMTENPYLANKDGKIDRQIAEIYAQLKELTGIDLTAISTANSLTAPVIGSDADTLKDILNID